MEVTSRRQKHPAFYEKHSSDPGSSLLSYFPCFVELRDLWYNSKQAKKCVMGASEVENREKGVEEIFEEIP